MFCPDIHVLSCHDLTQTWDADLTHLPVGHDTLISWVEKKKKEIIRNKRKERTTKRNEAKKERRRKKKERRERKKQKRNGRNEGLRSGAVPGIVAERGE